MGVIVDDVSEVVNIRAEQIEPTPSFGPNVDTDFIMGVGQVGKNVIMLLDIGKILSCEEIKIIDQVSH